MREVLRRIRTSVVQRLPKPRRRERSQAFCRRQTAAMRSIAAFGAAKRKCAGTRSRRSRRSTPVSCRAVRSNQNFICRIRTSVVQRLPKPRRRVRLPYPAPKRDAIQMDGISFWNMGSAANPWFDRPMILGASPASALRAGGFGNQPKQSPWRHGGGIAAGVLPYCPIHPPIHSVRMAQRKTPSLWMVFFVGARFPQRTRGFDHKHFAVARRLRCTASQLLAQPKENA